ncbi:hypothetical protein KR059_003911 [Drosophila kikkawai]|nr:hypothetical protein KR059_003911 [Drosophila kikkawai]
MHAHLKLLVRLLFAVLLVSLISTLFLGKHIHKHIIESVKSKIIHGETEIPKDIPKGIHLESSLAAPFEVRKTPGNIVPLDSINVKEFDSLKVNRNALSHLLRQKGALRDWHDRRAMILDRHRQGLGKMGRPVAISNQKSLKADKKLLGIHGFNAELSDLISVNRSLPDVRSQICHLIKYPAKLPMATVIIAFHNEHLSVLLRSIHSLVNRSPPGLLGDIILVDDASTLVALGQKLARYLRKTFGELVTLVRLPKRRGLIKARMEGAQRAPWQVLIFLDSHIEVTHNWLPPLLAPIAAHRTIATGPIVDAISRETFAYEAGAALTRSGFNWHLHVKHLPPFPEDSQVPSSPYRTPLLVGGLAIDRSYFWELGGYDEELDIWGGEYLQMSFKIWMCGGMLLYVPCSRVAHISRGPVLERASPRKYNFLGRNYKRVAEVWMDDYKKFVYQRNPELFHNVDAGNLTAVKAQRKQLKCKSFHWYMTKVAPDFLEKFPLVDLPPLASGVIQSVAYPSYCMDTLKGEYNQPMGLAPCNNPPSKHQDWTLTREHEIRLKSGNACLEISDTKDFNVPVKLYHCHSLGGNQFWYYNPKLKWIQQREGWYHCLEAIPPVKSNPGRVVSNYCRKSNKRQKWNFGYH